ncbi:MAG: thiamine pyrophosphate-dependent dehydrogenase E1 component subunit alpha [Thermoleophilia bacterium]
MTAGGPAERYRRMYLIRRFEETLLDMFSQGLLVGTTHTCIGQEADAVGVIGHLRPGLDQVVSNHRCHGHYIAFTGDLSGLAAEVMGRSGGTCSGRGGSQHLCRDGFYTNGVQGSIVPLATGIALAERERGAGAVTTVFIGDGTLGQGAVYECLNMASLWRLPLLIVVENNRYAQTTPVELAVAGTVPDRARAFGVDAAHVETTDVEEIHVVAGELVDHVRSGRPAVLSIDTYRLRAHSKGDDVRDPAEVDARWAAEPLAVAGARLDPALRAGLEADADRELAEALAVAHASPVAVLEEAVA